jgi:ankyrin repeat protein
VTEHFHLFHPDTCEIAELLLSRGAYVDPICENGTPLHIAAHKGNVRMLELLLRHQADVIILFFPSLVCYF